MLSFSSTLDFIKLTLKQKIIETLTQIQVVGDLISKATNVLQK